MTAAELALRADRPDEREIRSFFSQQFAAFRIRPDPGANPYPHGFVTGYYEPEVLASPDRTVEFTEPVRGRPSDLNTHIPGAVAAEVSQALATLGGSPAPYWSRAEIDGGLSSAPVILWVRDAIELFMIQVQGSARVILPDGKRMRLVYDGRNGLPYESIGRILINEGHISPEQMSLDVLKNWVRSAGLEPGKPGRALLHRNPSYIFFRLEDDVEPADGPIGGEGVPLTALRSLAIDRSIWSYGLPFWVGGRLPGPDASLVEFQRLMIAQDTGSAIVGAARGDIFYGSGDAAGQVAARVRHEVDMFVLMPKR
jgi:membrane-bound lytic murein transglycosylase A